MLFEIFQIEKIVESEEGEVSSRDVLNLVHQLPDGVRLGKTEAQKLLERLEADKWVDQVSQVVSNSSNSNFTLTEIDIFIYKCSKC